MAKNKDSIYIVVEEHKVQWLKDLFQYWFLKDISKEIKRNGEYFPYYYYRFEVDEFKEETLKILKDVFLDRYKYVSTRIIAAKENFIDTKFPSLKMKGLGTVVIQNVILPKSFEDYIIINNDKTIEEIFDSY
jgi:hypothetical protein